MVRFAAWLALIVVVTGCLGVVSEPAVEAGIVELVPTDSSSGSFVLSLYLGPEQGEGADVWLYQLNDSPQVTVQTEEELPIAVEPGELRRVRFDYQLGVATCRHFLRGSIYDTLTGDFTEVSSRSTLAPGCDFTDR